MERPNVCEIYKQYTQTNNRSMSTYAKKAYQTQ